MCLRQAEGRRSWKRQRKTEGKMLVIRCASLRPPLGRAQNPLRPPKPRSLSSIQHHCLSLVCDPRNRKFPRQRRKDKPREAEMHRIEEGVVASLSVGRRKFPRAAEGVSPNYTSCLHWKTPMWRENERHELVSVAQLDYALPRAQLKGLGGWATSKWRG